MARAGLLAAAALSVPGMSATVGASVASRTSTHRAAPPVSIPQGWASYSYGGLTISVPKSWAVKHNVNCDNTAAPGAILLGYPKVLINCANYEFTWNFVALYYQHSGTISNGTRMEVNGVSVIPNSSAAGKGYANSTYVEWLIPSLGLAITASGSEVGRILHTIRRA